MKNELKIRIKRDSKGNALSLDKITIEAAESLKIFIDSLIEFSNIYGETSGFNISLKQGSVETCLVFPASNDQVTQDINNILEGNSFDNNKIKALKTIQDRIKLNGLAYEVLWETDNEVKDITKVFKGPNFSYKRKRNEYGIEVVFLQGRLFETGGKKTTNIHIEGHNVEYKIDCTEQEAIEINRLLYQKVYLSAAKKSNNLNKESYQLIDYYSSVEEYNMFSDLYQGMTENNELDRFDILHDKIYNSISKDKIVDIKKIMKIFDNDFTEKGIIRTILMSLKPVIKQNYFAELLPLYKNLSNTLRSKSYNNII